MFTAVHDSYFNSTFIFSTDDGLNFAYGVTTYDDDQEVTEDPDYGVVRAKKVTWGLDDIPGDAEF